MADQVRMLSTSSIRPNGKSALRQVDKSEEAWLEFVDSVKSKGILQSLLVRKAKDPETNDEYYSLIDGLHRWTAATDLGIETVPACITEMSSDAEALEAQMVTNLHQIETKPAAYADGLARLLAVNMALTVPQLAEKLGKSYAWLTQRLKIAKLSTNVKALVDEGKISVTNAQQLAKLPEDEINDFIDRAITLPPQQFIPLVTQRSKQIKDAQSQGRPAPPKEFSPVPTLRGAAEITKEIDSLNAGRGLIAERGAATPLDGWQLALEWAISMDPASQQKQREADDARKAEKEKRRKELAEAKAQKKLEEGARTAVELEEAVR